MNEATSLEITQEEANCEGIRLAMNALNPNRNPNEPEEVSIVDYLLTNPHTGARMDYAESRMMYG